MVNLKRILCFLGLHHMIVRYHTHYAAGGVIVTRGERYCLRCGKVEATAGLGGGKS